MISCLNNLIGLRAIAGGPKSGEFINELPGIETTRLDLIRKEETYDIEDAWDEIEKRAIRKFEQELKKWASKYFKNTSYIQTTITGQIDTNITIPSSAVYNGWYFDGYAAYYKNLKLIVPEIEIFPTNSGTSEIFVFNAATGETIETIGFEFEANKINRIHIGKEYAFWRYPKLFIAYNAEDISVKRADNLSYSAYYASLSIRTVSNTASIVSGNLAGSNQTGMILKYNAECSLDNWTCQRLQLFIEPFKYLLGIEFMNENIYSERINHYTLLDRDQAIELRDEWQEYFNSVMDRTLEALNVDYDNDYCFECDRAVMHKYAMP